MSEARAITNTIGNAVGTLAIARWVGAVDQQRLQDVLDGKISDDPETASAPQPTQPADVPAPGTHLARAADAHAGLMH